MRKLITSLFPRKKLTPTSLLTRARQHELRIRLILRTGSAITITICLAWLILFLVIVNWLGIAFVSLTIAALFYSLRLEQRNLLRAASWIWLTCLHLAVFLSAALTDIPTLTTPRTIHLCFLPLAAAGCLLLREENAFIRNTSTVVCLLAYGYFAVVNPIWITPYLLDESIRVPGTALNVLFGLVALFFTLHAFQADVKDKDSLDGEIADGLIRGEMELYYQPQLNEKGEVVGAESLLRWRHPARGFISPAEFIPVAEAAGLMPQLGDWVLKTACEQLASWSNHPSMKHLWLAVNVSASQFVDQRFAENVLIQIADAGAPARLLKIELTESTLAQDVNDVVSIMSMLGRHGIQFVLDDFGTGFSALSYLRQLPLTQLKIDKSFVGQMTVSEKDLAIVRTIITLATELNLQILAEGVETEEQRSLLFEMGCMHFQGFLFGRAIPSKDFLQFVERREKTSNINL